MRSSSALTAMVLALTLALHPAIAKTGGCTLVVDGKTYLDGPCNIDLEPGGDFSIGTGDAATASKHFAYVALNGDGTATGNWSGTEPGSTHAHTPLGTLRRQGACWINDRARVCARAAP